jgi:glycosyltransferase involved in cell wall biosynthesis
MGGAETWLMEVLRRWAQTGAASMDFLATSGEEGVFDDEARALGAKIHYLAYGRRNLPAFVRGFRRILVEGRYDAIHDHQDYPSGWHFLMGMGRTPPIRITHVHNPAYQILNNNGLTLPRRISSLAGRTLVSGLATHIAGTSRQVLGEYGFDDQAFRHIPKAALHCGFDPARFAGDRPAARGAMLEEFGWSAADKIVLFAGRMDQSPDIGASQNHKNSGFAIDVTLKAMARDPRLRMIMVGEQSAALPVLQARIAAVGMADRFRFAGLRKDIEHLMLASDLLFFPSRGEGLGMVAVEAQAAGLPVLASTAVPRECVVVETLVKFRDLVDDQALWADDMLTLTAADRSDALANSLVAASPFAINRSASALATLYGTGELPRP